MVFKDELGVKGRTSRESEIHRGPSILDLEGDWSDVQSGDNLFGDKIDRTGGDHSTGGKKWHATWR